MADNNIFNNTKNAFKLKSDSDLKQSILIFKLINIPFLTPIGIYFTRLALKVRLPIEWLIKRTIFKQFCGGVKEKDCIPIVESMYKNHVSSVLDYSVEGKKIEEEFDKAMSKKIEIIKFASVRDEIPFAVAKPTGLGRFEIWEKISQKKQLNKFEQLEWSRINERINNICQAAVENNIQIMFDAEESWMQDAADDLLIDMMKIYNKKKAYIFNTLQCYRWDRFDYIKKIHQTAKNDNFKLGFKVVRGAYMEKENQRAKKMNYPSPICKDKEASDLCFNQVMTYCIENIKDISVFIGTHNETSSHLALELMKQKNLQHDDRRIWFGQLYGMSDNITYNLGENNLNAIKLIPFGPVRDVVPYLFRRAQENSSVQGQSSRELSLLLQERKRRRQTEKV